MTSKIKPCIDCGKPINTNKRTVTGACRKCCGKYRVAPTFYNSGTARNVSIEEIFWKNVQKNEGCWIWTGQESGGYGQIRKIKAHRFSYELHFGPIPEGMLVCHNCPDGDNPICVNPDHLFLGTNAENLADMVAKGRSTFGERHASARLGKEDVVKIREIWQSKGMSPKELAQQFGVSAAHIRKIVNYKKWKRLD